MKLSTEMKRILALCAVLLLTAGFAVAQEGDDEMAAEGEMSAEMAAEETMSADPMPDASYAIGLNIGRNMSSQGVAFDEARLIAGLRDGLSGAEPALTDEQMQAAMQAFQQKMMAEQQAQRQAAAADNSAAGEAFLAANADQEGVVVADSGLQYKVDEPGEGPPPTPADQVVVHYRGKLIDGTEFDSSYSRGEPATFPLGGVIEGFSEGLQKFGKGGKGTIWIPGELGYGENGAPGGVIGPNATLVFEIELVDVIRGEAAASGDSMEDGEPMEEAEPMDDGGR
jgi:FKBP-type peptidyl-prolyl cis-trans isomerase FklB